MELLPLAWPRPDCGTWGASQWIEVLCISNKIKIKLSFKNAYDIIKDCLFQESQADIILSTKADPLLANNLKSQSSILLC